jgi:drug/metabolite transporter (DMT)-like permease
MANQEQQALRDAFLAVLAFSATLPLTRLALESFDPLALTFGRLLGATLCAWVALELAGVKLPRRHQMGGLIMVALGGVLGFPLLLAFALEHHAAAPAAIPMALIPLATAIWTRLRGHEKPSSGFWVWSLTGSLILLLYLLQAGTAIAGPELFAASLAAAMAYAEGGRLAREMPGWQVMAWALMLASPISAFGFGASWAHQTLPTTPTPWLALGFLALITQFGAFWLWYRALANDVARKSQIQLLQAFFTLLLSTALLGESLSADLWLFAAAVVVSLYFAQNSKPQQPLEEKRT